MDSQMREGSGKVTRQSQVSLQMPVLEPDDRSPLGVLRERRRGKSLTRTWFSLHLVALFASYQKQHEAVLVSETGC